jgi:hypothetical protein
MMTPLDELRRQSATAKKRGRPQKVKRGSGGWLNLTRRKRELMIYLMRRDQVLGYGRWEPALASKIAKVLGLRRETVSRCLHDPAFREDYFRGTLTRRLRNPSDLVTQLVNRLKK